MKARTQMLCFLYLPIAAVASLYIALVVLFFQPSYTKATDKGADRAKVPASRSAPRVPQIQQPPAASSGTSPAARETQ